MRIIILSVFLLLASLKCLASPDKSSAKEEASTDTSAKEEPSKIGNFVLPSSQQPGAFLSFGQHVIDKNKKQFLFFTDYIKGSGKHNIDVAPGFNYGITDKLSIFVNMPFAARYKLDGSHSSGIEDMLVQLEYAFSNSSTTRYTQQATFVTNVTFPTGSTEKSPPTGVGSESFFLGATFIRTYVDWFGFTSHGVVLTTSHDETKFGNQFLYQFGIGRNIFSIPSEWIFAWLIEADGTYTQKNKIQDVTDPNSGGNILFITPSLWISSPHLILQLGGGVPVAQHLFGTQHKSRYLLGFQFIWTF